MNSENIKNIDSIISYLLIRKLICPIIKSKAYQLGLVDITGKVIKEPSNPTEESALTVLDKLVFKLKRLLGTKLLVLNKFMYINTLNNSMYDKLNVKGNINQRTEIKKMINDIKNLQESNNINEEELIYSLLTESLENIEDE